MSRRDRIVVAGAGSIGCFVGGLLGLGGRDVTLLARQRIVDDLAAHGLRLTDLTGLDERLAPLELQATADPDALLSADIVLVAVKSGDTAEMGELIALRSPAHALVVSLQNGVANADVLRSCLRGRTVLAGMVPFNVAQLGPGLFHRGTSGSIVVDDACPGLAGRLTAPGPPIRESGDITGVLWGKLLLNLNNALNALSGLPLREQLESRAWRRVLAAQMEEALAILQIAGITPRIAGPLPARLVPLVLRLPTLLYRTIAASSLRIDPLARSSMWDDLRRGRKTEVDQLQGAVVEAARRLGREAPVNRRVLDLIQAAEAGTGPTIVHADQVALRS